MESGPTYRLREAHQDRSVRVLAKDDPSDVRVVIREGNATYEYAIVDGILQPGVLSKQGDYATEAFERLKQRCSRTLEQSFVLHLSNQQIKRILLSMRYQLANRRRMHINTNNIKTVEFED